VLSPVCPASCFGGQGRSADRHACSAHGRSPPRNRYRDPVCTPRQEIGPFPVLTSCGWKRPERFRPPYKEETPAPVFLSARLQASGGHAAATRHPARPQLQARHSHLPPIACTAAAYAPAAPAPAFSETGVFAGLQRGVSVSALSLRSTATPTHPRPYAVSVSRYASRCRLPGPR